MKTVKLQLIPARGRKLQAVVILAQLMALQLIPARGRKLVLAFSILLASLLQLILARGRKPPSQREEGAYTVVATYPREGTETNKTVPAWWFLWGCNLSPRGDGNAVGRAAFHAVEVATYPREGTETRQRSGTSSMVIRCNLSPRGDKNLLSSKDKIGYNEAKEILPKRRNAYTNLCADFLYLPC